MSFTLRMELIIFSILFMILILWNVKNEKISMKYAIIWLLCGFFMIVSIAIPNFIEKMSDIIGFETTSNMVFFFGIIILLFISFNLTLIVSKQSLTIRKLIQELSIINSKKLK